MIRQFNESAMRTIRRIVRQQLREEFSLRDRLSADATVHAHKHADISIKNNSGSDIEAFHILAVGAAIEDPDVDLEAYQGAGGLPAFAGDFANDGSPGDWGKWCVVQRAIPAGEFGPAKVSGVTPVFLDKETSRNGLPYADINGNQTDTTEAQEEWYGAATILDMQNTTSDRWALINMHGYVEPIYRATASEAISASAAGDALIVDDFGLTVSARTVEVHNRWMENGHDVANGDELLIKFNRQENRWIIVSAECGT